MLSGCVEVEDIESGPKATPDPSAGAQTRPDGQGNLSIIREFGSAARSADGPVLLLRDLRESSAHFAVKAFTAECAKTNRRARGERQKTAEVVEEAQREKLTDLSAATEKVLLQPPRSRNVCV